MELATYGASNLKTTTPLHYLRDTKHILHNMFEDRRIQPFDI